MGRKTILWLSIAVAVGACVKQPQTPHTTGDQVAVQPNGEAVNAAETQEPVNPFFAVWDTPFGVPPFDKIKSEHFLPAFKRAVEIQKEEIGAIVANEADPTFENTLEAIEESGELLSKVKPVFLSLLGSDTTDELQQIATEVKPMLAKHKDDILLNQQLFEKIKSIHEKQKYLSLSAEQTSLLQEYYKDFVRGGADIDEAGRKQLRDINKDLSLLTLNFSQNLLKENQQFEMVLETPEDLAGLPDPIIASAAQAAKARGHEGKWVFTLDKPSFIPFLQYSTRRDLREKIFKGYVNRSDNNDKFDNKENIRRITELRIQKAQLLGFESYADFMLDRRMAKTPKAVYDLSKKVWQASLPVAKKEARALQKMIRKEGKAFKLQPWDWWYYAEKLRKEKYDLDEAELRPYFKLENVREGAFAVATKLYGIQFIERQDIPKYHPDATVFEVQEADGSHIGILYVDYFPRKGKRGGAWCGGFRGQYVRDGKKITPIVTNVGNFSTPTGDKPALLSFEEVETLFHEFGHALHFLFSDVTYERLSEEVTSDFVELPSQIMENWAAAPEVLKMYAKHYETGEPIPDALIEKITNSRYFNQGFVTVEYLSAAFLDMDWHTRKKPVKEDANTFEAKALKKIGLIPEIVVRYRSTNFAHIFSSDYYTAGYYSYMWSEVLDADAFEAFKQNGLFDKATAKSFRDNILSRGGAEDPMVLYKRFRGAEPKIEPMLKRKGMI
ncbi:MAG: M3 family metallopeptidase [Myxococcota bacterium]|nr:M3 family metallopeptidase [Myxococcota bacterium]